MKSGSRYVCILHFLGGASQGIGIWAGIHTHTFGISGGNPSCTCIPLFERLMTSMGFCFSFSFDSWMRSTNGGSFFSF